MSHVRWSGIGILVLLLMAVAGCLARGAPAGAPRPPADPQMAANARVVTPASGSLAGRPVDEIRQVSRLPAPLAAPLDFDPLKATIHQLDNGLTVYISTDREQPRISAWVVIRAGSATDPANSTGLAHYLEHLLFKGTLRLGTLDGAAERGALSKIEQLYGRLAAERDQGRRRGLLTQIDRETQATARWVIPNEMDRMYGALGFRGFNAFTSDEMTSYVVDLPSSRLEHWAMVEAERFTSPVFRLFFPELEAVYEEKNASLDSPEGRASEALLKLLFPRHPYGTQPTLGTVEHLKNPAYADAVAYFRRWYVPNNVAIVLAGDVDAAQALPVLRRYFGAWEPRRLEPRPPPDLPPPRGRVFDQIVADGEEQLTMAWHAAPSGHADEAPLEVMNTVMGHGTAGLLQAELLLPQRVPRAGSYLDLRNEAGYWALWGTARVGQRLEDVEAALLETAAKLKQGKFTQADLDAIILNSETGEKWQLESNGARVGRMAASFVRREPWAVSARRLERLRQVTREDVLRVANRYLGGDFAVVYRRKGSYQPPRMPKPPITPLPLEPGRRSAFAKQVEALPATPLEPVWLVEGEHYVRRRLPAGKLLAVRNRRNDLFSVSYSFDFGSRRQPLLCFALEAQKKAGAGSLDAEALQKKLFALGARVRTGCGIDGASIYVDGIDRTMDQALALAAEWFRKARFEDADVAKLLATTLTDRKNTIEDPRSAAGALAAFAQRGSESGYLLATSNQALARARAGELRRLLAALPDHQHRTFYFGPRAPEEAARVVALGNGRHKVRPRPATRYRKVERDTLYLLGRDLAQAQVSFTFGLPPSPKEEQARSILLSQYLGAGGQSLLYQEIRETRGLAYSVWGSHAWSARPTDQSRLSAGMETQPDKTAEAVRRLMELLREVPIREDPLAVAKAAVDEQYRTTRAVPRAVAGLVDAWDDFGHKGDPRPRLRAEVAALAAEDLTTYLQRLVKTPVILAITADRKRLDLEAFRKAARLDHIAVVEPPLESLFGYGPFPPD